MPGILYRSQVIAQEAVVQRAAAYASAGDVLLCAKKTSLATSTQLDTPASTDWQRIQVRFNQHRG